MNLKTIVALRLKTRLQKYTFFQKYNIKCSFLTNLEPNHFKIFLYVFSLLMTSMAFLRVGSSFRVTS